MTDVREIGLPGYLQHDLDAFKEFAAILAEVPYLSELQRKFYRVYLEARRAALAGQGVGGRTEDRGQRTEAEDRGQKTKAGASVLCRLSSVLNKT